MNPLKNQKSADFSIFSVFTNRNFPKGKGLPTLDVSMKDSGKSRADLWAFAALVGLYKGIENNNKACDGKANAAVCGHREAFQDGCEVDFPRIPRFQTGRKDCIGNVQFFKFGSNFGSNLNHFF